MSSTSALTLKDELRAQLVSIMMPATDLSAQVHLTIAAQQALADRMTALSTKLAQATATTPEDREVMSQVETYANRLRNTKKRVVALQSSLEQTQSRLVRVHAHLKSSAAVLDKRNADQEAALERMIPQPDSA